MKTYTLEELKENYFGKLGTPKRDSFEKRGQKWIEKELRRINKGK